MYSINIYLLSTAYSFDNNLSICMFDNNEYIH